MASKMVNYIKQFYYRAGAERRWIPYDFDKCGAKPGSKYLATYTSILEVLDSYISLISLPDKAE